LASSKFRFRGTEVETKEFIPKKGLWGRWAYSVLLENPGRHIKILPASASLRDQMADPIAGISSAG
jgi:hypothetical protein